MRHLWLSCVVVSLVAVLSAPVAHAQEAGATTPVAEGIDPTRLDVERLPPEAIRITRDLYAHGFFVEAFIGGRGFYNGVGQLSQPGLWTSVGFGLEIFRWLLVKVAAEGSFHGTDAPPPPGPTAFEIIGATAEVRVQANFTPRFAMWVGGEGGIVYATGDVLRMYGLQDSNTIGLTYGGTAGIDWHQSNRHHSIGVMGGARLYPSLVGIDGGQVLGIHGAFYVRYVF